MGEVKTFRARGVGNSSERTGSAIVLPFRDFRFRLTGVYTTPICDDAIDSESQTLFMIQLKEV